MYVIAYVDERGQAVGWLSQSMLMARSRELARVLDEADVRYSARYYLDAAARLLEGPHPLDHHGSLRVVLEDAMASVEGA